MDELWKQIKSYCLLGASQITWGKPEPWERVISKTRSSFEKAGRVLRGYAAVTVLYEGKFRFSYQTQSVPVKTLFFSSFFFVQIVQREKGFSAE